MTPNPLSDALDLELHPAAQSAVLDRVNEFATTLILEAKRLAYQKKADVVLSSYVEESLELITSGRQESLTKQLAQFIGGAFFGAFIQGFITELSNGNTFLIVMYVILGFAGFGLFTWGRR
jgi:hypothetical protein